MKRIKTLILLISCASLIPAAETPPAPFETVPTTGDTATMLLGQPGGEGYRIRGRVFRALGIASLVKAAVWGGLAGWVISQDNDGESMASGAGGDHSGDLFGPPAIIRSSMLTVRGTAFMIIGARQHRAAKSAEGPTVSCVPTLRINTACRSASLGVSGTF